MPKTKTSSNSKKPKLQTYETKRIKKHYWFQNNRWEDQLVFVAVPEIWKNTGQ